MDIQSEKLSLIEWIANQKDKNIIKELLAVKKSAQEDWWDEISNDEKQQIQIGLEQVEKGQTIPHEEVMKKHKKWLTK